MTTKTFEFALRLGFGQAGETADRLTALGYTAAHGMNGQVYVTITAERRNDAALKASGAFRLIGISARPSELRFVATKEVR